MSDAGKIIMVKDTVRSTPNVTVIRANLDSAEDAEQWLKKYSEESKTSWVVDHVTSNCTRMVFHKVWVCHLGHRKKSIIAAQKEPCTAKVDIKIKKLSMGTKKNDRFLLRDPPLPTLIKLYSGHNHVVGTPDAPISLRPTAETKARFLSYFDMGMSPAEAIQHNERLLAAESNNTLPLAKGPTNPIGSSVYTWHQKWREAKYGSSVNPLPKLAEKTSYYAASGTDVRMSSIDDRWAVLVVTSIMHRAQQLQSASELIFVDSVSSCDKTKSIVTSLLTPTKSGAVPIAMIIHNDQSAEGYQMAFSLLKTSYSSCFGNEEFPKAFVSKNSAAVKAALQGTWPGARQLLCHVHTLQTEWRWLTAAENKVPKADRHELLSSFQKILNARWEEEIEKAKEEMHHCKFRPYAEHVEAFFAYEKEWSLAYRVGLTTQSKSVIDYSEVSIRVQRDILLSKAVAHNAVALVDFIVNNWQAYLEARTLRHTGSDTMSPCDHQGNSCKASLRKLLGQIPDAFHDKADVQMESKNDFSFRRASGHKDYGVQSDIGLCSCWPGSQGAFCRHQVAVVRSFGAPFPCAPKVALEDRCYLLMLALGEKALPFPASSIPTALDVGKAHCQGVLQETPAFVGLLQDQPKAPQERKFEDLVSSLQQLHELAKHNPGYLTLLDRLVSEMKMLTTSSAAYCFFLRLDASAAAERLRATAPSAKRPRICIRPSPRAKDILVWPNGKLQTIAEALAETNQAKL